MDGCNGYSNWETWSVGSYIDNTREEAAKWGFEASIADSPEELAETMEDYFENEILPANCNPMILHFYTEGINGVDWQELAEEYYKENHEQEEEESTED